MAMNSVATGPLTADRGKELADAPLRMLAENLRQLVDWLETGSEPAKSPDPAGDQAGHHPPPLIDTHRVKKIIAFRSMRNRMFGADLFGEPVWDMLLDLFLAQLQQRRISVTSLAIASNVPTTTALRYIEMMIEAQLVERLDDPSDGRRKMIALTHFGYRKMGHLFELLES